MTSLKLLRTNTVWQSDGVPKNGMRGVGLAFGCLAALCVHGFVASDTAEADLVLALTADPANSSTSGFGGSIERTLDDPFAYDPANPTSPLPEQFFPSNSPRPGFHGQESNNGDVVLSYRLDTALTLTGDLHVDLYGRDDQVHRDNNFDILLFNGDYLLSVASLIGAGIPDAEPYHVRGTLPLVGTTFDRLRVVGHNTSEFTTNSTNFFTLMEIRATAIPEPSALALLCVVWPAAAALWLWMRWRQGAGEGKGVRTIS